VTALLTLEGGTRIAYQDEGDPHGQPVLLLGGLGDDRSGWDDLVPHLPAHRVLRGDNRGAGASDAPPGPYAMERLADDWAAVLAAADAAPAHVVGASMGGAIALELALRHPRCVRSLILCCTCAAPGPWSGRLLGLWQRMAELGPAGYELAALDGCLHGFAPGWTSRHEAAFDDWTRPVQPRSAYLAQLAAMQAFDARARLDQIAVPVLVLHGREDGVLPLGLAEELAAGIRGAELEVLPCGHAAAIEAPEAYAASISDALQRFAAAGGEGRAAAVRAAHEQGGDDGS
jgi:3-oxoadipate enol-lactonase